MSTVEEIEIAVTQLPDWLPQLRTQFSDILCTDTAPHAIGGIIPACVAAPIDAAQTAALMRFAAAHKIPVVPCGGGTSQGAIAPPAENFLLLKTALMKNLIHHEPGDMVATAQGGMSLAAFQALVSSRGQYLPIDAPGDATLGGIVAANAHGPRALGYGTLRDMVLGMSVVNGDGVLRKCGGKVVKNVTGYALDKLYIGCHGTLGVITEITFKLRPLPVDGRQWSEAFDSLANAVAAMSAISEKNLPLEMLRIVNFNESARAQPHLLACAAGTHAELVRIESELKLSVPTKDFTGIVFDPELAKTDPRYTASSFAYTQSQTWGDSEINILKSARERKTNGATLRFGCAASKLNAALDILSTRQNSPYSLGMNGGLIELVPLDETEAARISAEFEKHSINFAYENVVGLKLPNPNWRWGKPRAERALMAGIKSALDPHNIMNAGRFVV